AAVHVQGQGHIAQRRQLPGAPLDIVVQSPELRGHQNGGARSLLCAVVGKIATQRRAVGALVGQLADLDLGMGEAIGSGGHGGLSIVACGLNRRQPPAPRVPSVQGICTTTAGSDRLRAPCVRGAPRAVVPMSSPDSVPFIQRGTADYRRATLALFCAGFATFAMLYCVQPLLPLL